jgi:hypothetical protein
MLASIPEATPFAWPEGAACPEAEEPDAVGVAPPPSGQATGTGIAHLQEKLRKSNADMSTRAKSALWELCVRHSVPPVAKKMEPPYETYEEYEAEDDEDEAPPPPPPSKKVKKEATVTVLDPSVQDETALLERASKREVSLLASLLAVVDQAGGGSAAVRSQQLVKQTALAVHPSGTPGKMDAKEMVLAALHFLSSEHRTVGGDGRVVIELPLLKPVAEAPDLEKRSYEKAWPWQLGALVPAVTDVLEDCFYDCSAHYAWLSRDRFCPRTGPSDDTSWLATGRVPPQLLLKIPKRPGGGGGGQSKKRTSPTVPRSSVSPQQQHFR